MDRKKAQQEESVTEKAVDASKMATELQDRETRLTAFFQGAPVPTFVIDENNRVRRWNRALEALSGIPAGEMLGTKAHWRAFYPEERPCLADLLIEGDPSLFPRWYGEKKIQPGLIDEAMEATDFFPNLGKSGKWLRFTAAVIRSPQGKILGAVETLEDITEKKQAEAALLDKEAKYRFLIENSNDIIWTFDLSSMTYTYCSKSVERLLGYSTSEVVGKILGDIFSAQTRDAVTAAFTAVAMEKNTTDRILMDAAHIAKDGRTVWMEINAVLQRDDQGNPLAFMGVTRDITERRQAAEKLRKSEEKFRTLAEKMGDIVWSLDLNLKTTYVSPSVQKIFGYTPEERMQQSPDEIMTPESYHRVMETLGKEMTREKEPDAGPDRVISIEVEYYHKDGHSIWMENTVRGVRDESDRLTGIYGVSRDITPRKIAEAALRESEEKYRRIADNISDVVWMADMDLNLVYVSPSVERMAGETPAAQMARPLEERFPPDSVDIMSAIFAEELEKEKDPTCDRNRNRIAEVRHLRADGNTIWVSINMSFIRDQSGQAVGILGVTRDITDRRRAEEALRESEARFRLFSQMAPVGVVIEDHAEKNLYVSQKFTEMLGYSNDDIPSAKDWWPLAFPDKDVREKILREWAAEVEIAKKTNLEIQPFEARVTCKNGTVKDIEFRMRIADRLNFITLTDITDRKQAESEREKLHAQLIQAQKMESVGRLAGGVAHDFNNMLSVILGNAELAMEKMDQVHPLYADLKEIDHAARRSADLVRQLLAFARKQTIAPRMLDLNETVEGMLKMLRRLIGEDIDLTWQPCASVWPIKMDPSQIDQVLANLCVNARDAIGGIGRVVIETNNVSIDREHRDHYSLFVPGDYVLLAVTDSGCGMDRKTLSHLFEPFFTTKDLGEGTGLGLATIHGIVHQNNGFIDVDTTPGRGTTFKIYIPRQQAAVEAGDADVLSRTPVVGGNETVLLVEDEPSILKMGKAFLEWMGYQVITAATPEDAIRLARGYAGKIHLLMTDVIMPEMNGRELAVHVASIYPQISCLFMSGYTADVIARHGVLDDDVHFIQKPFSRKELAAKVRQALTEGR